MRKRTNTNPCYFSPRALALPGLPPTLQTLGRRLARSAGSPAFSAPLAVAFASELIGNGTVLPGWSSGSSTRYLVLADVPDAVLPRVFSALDLRRPDQRLHLTRDSGAIRRLLVSTARREPMLGIVDAFVWGGALTLVTGEFQFRSFPMKRVPIVCDWPPEEQASFEISADGSHLHWQSRDVHLGVSQILQVADPMYLADIAIERNRDDHTGAALRRLREERRLRQVDIPGLSERQVRRVEDGLSRLQAATAEKFAAAFQVELGVMLDEVARHAGEIRAASKAEVPSSKSERRRSAADQRARS